MATFYPINSPLINYFFYKAPLSQNGPNVPLAGGFIFTYKDSDHTVMLPTYSDVSDPNNPVFNTNPIQLGQAGDCPLFYLNDELYYIVITDSSGDQSNPIATISHYNPANGTGSNPDVTTEQNFIANSQFTYPIDFSTVEDAGLCVQEETAVAWGWNFIQNDETSTQNTITFNNIEGLDVPGNPVNELQLFSSSPQLGESAKDLQSIIGAVNFMAGQEVTFAAEFISYLGNSTITLLLEKNYGTGASASDPDLLDIHEFDITSTRTQYVWSFTIPDNSGKNITPGNYTAIRIQFPLGQICQIGVTNVLVVGGNVSDPVFIPQSYNDEKSQIIGNSTQISGAGLPQNQSFYMYDQGQIFPYADTGTMVICPTTSVQPFRVVCDGTAYPVDGYTNGIPNSRLYSVLGNTYAGSGDLIVSASANVVTFTSGDGARQLTNYTAGTTSFPTPVLVKNGLQLGVSAAITGTNTVQFTWIGNFVVSQALPSGSPGGFAAPSLIGNYYINPVTPLPNIPITITIQNPGTTMAPAQATLTFNSLFASDYKTTGYTSATINFLEWATQEINTQGAWPDGLTADLVFLFDGAYDNPSGINANTFAQVSLNSGDSLTTILTKTVNAVNNPFVWQLTVNSTPAESQYFLYSSASTNYYGWFKVDGSGSDPMVVGRTGVEIDINSTDSFDTIAQKIAAETNSLTFSVPQQTDLPTIPTSGSAWFINL